MNFGFGTTSATGLIAPAETAAGALDEVAVTASKAPPLPEFDGTTSGLLITKEGELVPLQSGSPNPLFKNYPAAGHVEGKAAIYIRESGSSGGDVYHNNPNGTCGFCNSQIPTLLPEGSTLNVFPPPDAIPNNPWSQANPTNYTGNSNLPK